MAFGVVWEKPNAGETPAVPGGGMGEARENPGKPGSAAILAACGRDARGPRWVTWEKPGRSLGEAGEKPGRSRESLGARPSWPHAGETPAVPGGWPGRSLGESGKAWERGHLGRMRAGPPAVPGGGGACGRDARAPKGQAARKKRDCQRQPAIPFNPVSNQFFLQRPLGRRNTGAADTHGLLNGVGQ